MFCVYILQSIKNGKLYIGHTENLQDRFTDHNNGYSKYTQSGIPWKIVHVEEFDNRAEAMEREREVKRMKSRKYILKLIQKSQRK